jgi:hypothetical protein
VIDVGPGSDGIEERVFARVAEMTGAPRDVLTPATDLYGDLAVTGAAARSLLAALAGEFDIDLRGLRFHRHFDEGFSLASPEVLWTIAGSVLLAVASVPAAEYLETAFDLPGWGFYLFIALCIPLVPVWMHVGTLIFPRPADSGEERIPVTIEDLISAAREKRWPINYEGRYRS